MVWQILISKERVVFFFLSKKYFLIFCRQYLFNNYVGIHFYFSIYISQDKLKFAAIRFGLSSFNKKGLFLVYSTGLLLVDRGGLCSLLYLTKPGCWGALFQDVLHNYCSMEERIKKLTIKNEISGPEVTYIFLYSYITGQK